MIKNTSALRTSIQHEQNKMTDYSFSRKTTNKKNVKYSNIESRLRYQMYEQKSSIFLNRKNTSALSCTSFACFCFGSLLYSVSFDFVLYARPGFVIVLVFPVPHIMLVYLVFLILLFISMDYIRNWPIT